MRIGFNLVGHVCVLILGFSGFLRLTSAQPTQLTGRDYAVELTANLASDPPEITLTWPGDQYANGYTVRRKYRDEKAWQDIATLDGSSSSFTDRTVKIGTGYEYQVVKDSSLGLKAYGYIYSGINMPLVEDRGTVIVLVEQSLANVLASELLRLEYDLIGDGWTVERATVSATNSPPEVKGLLQSIYAKNPGQTHALFLFGHIPVAYSGNIMPDGHENHLGAWPADVYYADIDGLWTDSTVDSKTAEQPRNWNVPGDGKFDQDEPPSGIELESGRVDFSRMTCFLNKTPSRSEVDLARQYLDKDHRFRTGRFPVAERAIIFDRIESKTAEPVAAMAWRNFAPLVGRDVQLIGDSEYFPKVSTGTYLWSSVTAGGSYTASDRVGTSDEFALYDVNVVFSTFLGSYYGDWDVESSFLRAPLGAHGTLLSTVYSGQPQWLFHHMGLNETIGYSAKVTQENNKDGTYPPHNNGAGEVHVALLGDPTLRAYPISTVLNLKGERTDDGVIVGWQVPVIDGYLGCLVYTASNPNGPYRRVTADPITATSFRVRNIQPTDWVMVKTIALTRTPSGSFYNASVGMLYPDPLAVTDASPPEAPANLSVARVTAGSITLTWVGGSARALGFRVERKDPGAAQFHEIATTSDDTFVDSALASPGFYTYRVRAFNQSGNSPYSQEATATTLFGSAEFVGLDTQTQGNWVGAYGNDGVVIPGWVENLPANCSLTTSNVLTYRTSLGTDIRAPQLTNSVFRSQNCWVNGTPLGLHFSFTDEQVHQISLYMAAWSRRNPLIDLEVLDAVSGVSLDHRALSNIDQGVYAIYNVRRQVYVRITPPSILTNVEIYGLFFDRAKVAPPQLEPPAGSFPGRTQVTLSCATPNAVIYYTTDGTEPSEQSTRYTGPLTLRETTHLKARAFRDGFDPSAVAEGEYDNTVPNVAGVIGWDADTAGNWPAKYGSEGSWLPLGQPSFPGFFECSFDGGAPWDWSDQTSDPRALLASRTGDLRQALAWYATDSMTLNVNVYDIKVHAVSIYFLDYDNNSRVEQLEILDPNGTVKDKLTVDGFGNGRYLVLGVQGQIQLRLTRMHGPNAVLSGVFLDAAPLNLLVKSELIGTLSVNNGRLTFSLPAFPGLHVCTDRSTNLVDWECYATNTVTGSTAQISTSIDPFEPKLFFRTRLVP